MLMHTHIVSTARYYSQGAYCLSGALASCAPGRVAGCVSRMFGASFVFSVAFLHFACGAMRHGPTLAGRLKSCRRNDKDGATGSFGNFEAKRKKMKCLKLPTGSLEVKLFLTPTQSPFGLLPKLHPPQPAASSLTTLLALLLIFETRGEEAFQY